MHAAALSGRSDIVRDLLARGADATAVSMHGLTPFRLAAATGHAKVVRLLRRHGINE